mgnify:CR=1 FL=1
MIIQCDFDGTIIKNNLSVLIREEYACGDWQRIDSDYLHGHLTVEQSNKLQFALIKEPKERLQAFIRQHIELRPGFVEFVGYCQKSAIPFAIVSSGLDFYIEPVLAEIGMLDLELHCGQTTFSHDGIDGNALGDGMPVPAVCAQNIVAVPQVRAHPHRHRFLPDVQVQGRGDTPLQVQFVHPLFKPADEHQFVIKIQIIGFLSFFIHSLSLF